MVGSGFIGKRPLKESNHEMYTRIQRPKEKRPVEDKKKYIKHLKKMGTIISLATFMFDA